MSGVILNSKEKMKKKPVMWETPNYLFKWLDATFHFDLDPCSSASNRKCKWYYSKRYSGLTHLWHIYKIPAKWYQRLRKRIYGLFGIHKSYIAAYCNPPYNKIEPWIEKAYAEWKEHGVTSVFLIPANTCTGYWHDYCVKGQVFTFRRRVSFIDPRTGKVGRENPQSMKLVVFGDKKYRLGNKYGSIDVKEIKDRWE